jgi:hypothetical protein
VRTLSTALTRSRGHLAVLAAALATIALVTGACGGDSGDGNGKLVLTPVSADLLPVVISSDLGVGANRFILGLLDSEDAQVLGADLRLRFFLLRGQEATLKFEADADPIVITKTYTHTHDDGSVESHEAGETGVYVATADFDIAGQWRVEVTGSADGQALEPVSPIFEVREASLSPAIGSPAPRSVQPVLGGDVSDIKDIDTSEILIAEMHDTTIAGAVTSGKPTVIVFATPAFCVSRICGPAKQIVDDLYETYRGRANFIHVEPYDLAKARSGVGLEPLPFITDEWRLESEPWIFVVDAEGLIAGKFEGVVSYEELESTLKLVLSTR